MLRPPGRPFGTPAPAFPAVPAPQPSLPDLRAALQRVGQEGFALVRHALPPAWCTALLGEVSGERFWSMPEVVGRTRQRAQQLIVHSGDAGRPATAEVSAALGAAVREAAPAGVGLTRFAPSHTMYLRYAGSEDGMGQHRDGMSYVLLVCVLTLRGAARFSVMAGGGGAAVASWTTAPGDLCLLRAPGFAGEPDGRPWHRVDGPEDEERVSAVFRMSGRATGGGPSH